MKCSAPLRTPLAPHCVRCSAGVRDSYRVLRKEKLITTHGALTGDGAFNFGTAPYKSEGGFIYWWAQVNDIQQTRPYQNLPYLINNRDRHTAFAMTNFCVFADSTCTALRALQCRCAREYSHEIATLRLR